ncbi:MAG: hypothetical protein U0X20_10840 [Caldilineaceae bacterium]
MNSLGKRPQRRTRLHQSLWLCVLLIGAMLVAPAGAVPAHSQGDTGGDTVPSAPVPGSTGPHVTPGAVELRGEAPQPQHRIELAVSEPAASAPAIGEQVKPLYLPLLSGGSKQAQAGTAQAGAVQATKSTDMKILVIAADGSETDYPYITATLDQLGIQYDILLAATQPLVPEILSDGADHGYYQGVILVTGSLIYYDATSASWISGFDAQEWQTLWAYEAAFGVRQVTSYTVPGSSPDSYGLTYVNYQDTTSLPLTATFTNAGKQVYADLNTSNPVTFKGAWVYLGTVIDPNVTTPLLTTPEGYAIASITKYPDGRENLAITAGNNPYLIHSLQLSYGTVNWVTKGLFAGYRKAWINPQIDDLLIDNDMWDIAAQSDLTGLLFRMSGNDFLKAIDWQNNIRTKYPLASSLTLEWPFNGEGGLDDIFANDTLTPVVQQNQAAFTYVNHTYSHIYLDAPVTYQEILTELQKNDAAAQTLGFTRYHADTMVQPDISGLQNPAFFQAIKDHGIKYIISDTSRPGWNNPSPNIGIYPANGLGALVIPRRPTNLFSNLSTQEEWVSEYNCFYGPTGICAGGAFRYWDHDLTYAEILDKESDVWLQYLLKWDIDPLMFHQANVRAYDGTNSLLGNLIDATLAKYSQLSNVPIQFITQHDIGVKMDERMTYNAAGVTATLTPCQSIVLTSQSNARVPLTGVAYGTTESFAGQNISYVDVTASQPVTVSLPACN